MIIVSKLTIKPIETPDRLINYWKNEKKVVLFIFLFGLTFNISMILGPIYQGKLIDKIVKGDISQSILILAIFFVGLIALIQTLRYFKRFYIRRFANSTSALMRLMIYNTIMHKSVTKLDEERTGNIMTRTISDVDLCVEGMRKFTTEIFDTGVLMVSYIVVLCMIDIKITLMSCLFIPIAMMIAEKLKKVIYKFTIDYRQKSSELTELTNDCVDNALMYRVNGVEIINRTIYKNALEDLQNKAIKALRLENAMQPIYNVIAMAGVVAVLYYGGTNVILGEWRLGAFITYLTMFTALAVKASKAAKLFNSVQKSKISWMRIKPYLSDYQSNQVGGEIFHSKVNLKVENLSFRYSEDQNQIVKSINFQAKSGEIVGITGPVACGKSTLALALTGMYPYEGRIEINGKPIETYPTETLSNSIAYMEHEPHLLSDTLYNNITLGENKAINEVLKIVCIDEEVNAMKDGYNTMIGSYGLRLSGGQQARIALARTLLNKKKIIILDDPFSAIDMNTEKQIIKNIKNHYSESLIIIISHRLSIFKEVDQIIFLQNHKNTLYGTHEALMIQSELYSKIVHLQEAEGGGANEG